MSPLAAELKISLQMPVSVQSHVLLFLFSKEEKRTLAKLQHGHQQTQDAQNMVNHLPTTHEQKEAY